MRCQKLYFGNRRCRNSALAAGQWCRWHKIVQEFRKDLSARSEKYARSATFAAAVGVQLGGYALWRFAHHGSWLWCELALVALGSAIKLFADGIIAQDHPFAQAAWWGKMLTFGILLEVCAAAIAGWHITVDPARGAALVREFTSAPAAIKWVPPLAAALLCRDLLANLRVLMSRVLFIWRPSFNIVLQMAMIFLPAAVLLPLIASHFGSTRGDLSVSVPLVLPGLGSFFASMYAPPIRKPLLAVYVVGFILAEVVNKHLRQRAEALPVFRATIWPSFPVCCGAPGFGALAVGLVAFLTQGLNPWLLAAFGVIVSGVSAALGTKAVIRIHLQPLARQARQAYAAGRQEVWLYLRMPGRDGPLGFINVAPERAVEEIEAILEPSAAGTIQSWHEDHDFFVVRMRGTSADRILQVLFDWLLAIPKLPGSFAVMQRGSGANQEKVQL